MATIKEQIFAFVAANPEATWKDCCAATGFNQKTVISVFSDAKGTRGSRGPMGPRTANPLPQRNMAFAVDPAAGLKARLKVIEDSLAAGAETLNATLVELEADYLEAVRAATEKFETMKAALPKEAARLKAALAALEPEATEMNTQHEGNQEEKAAQ